MPNSEAPNVTGRQQMSWPPPRHQLPRAESRPTARRCRVLFPLLLLGGYLFVSLSLKSRVLASEPGAAAPLGCPHGSGRAAPSRRVHVTHLS